MNLLHLTDAQKADLVQVYTKTLQEYEQFKKSWKTRRANKGLTLEHYDNCIKFLREVMQDNDLIN